MPSRWKQYPHLLLKVQEPISGVMRQREHGVGGEVAWAETNTDCACVRIAIQSGVVWCTEVAGCEFANHLSHG